MAAIPCGGSCKLVTSLVWFPKLAGTGVHFGVPYTSGGLIGVHIVLSQNIIIGLENKIDLGFGVPKCWTATTWRNRHISGVHSLDMACSCYTLRD